MKCFKTLLFLLPCVITSGCSSPPEPPKPDKSPSETVNSSMPLWKENNLFIQAPKVSGGWNLKVDNFSGDNQVYPEAFWYGLLHSEKITVATGRKTDWFAVKNWLRQHGARQTIYYGEKKACEYCIDIYMSR
ncbi:cag pathogenicity island Cag12 family protein [Capnocytophaga gingivalis]|uniref:cag pathogenicity island Cag12 family protein n=1 Tax=Capnocytophaga gingivalis TaxID=1017 RepID=UPI0006813D0F|nr:cag pathogenicity island Cag12 family protein [Capnocytophaga gingivalis]